MWRAGEMPVTRVSSASPAGAALFEVVGDGSPFVEHVGLFNEHAGAQVVGGHGNSPPYRVASVEGTGIL